MINQNNNDCLLCLSNPKCIKTSRRGNGKGSKRLLPFHSYWKDFNSVRNSHIKATGDLYFWPKNLKKITGNSRQHDIALFYRYTMQNSLSMLKKDRFY
jgi:hypothetical protein